MELQNIRYITGIVKQGPTKITGYAFGTPTEHIAKPDIVSCDNIREYLLRNKAIVANAIIDSFGHAQFKTAEDENSYVTMNNSGFILGFNKRPTAKLHPGNKRKDDTGFEVATTSYIVVDQTDTEVCIMNLNGTIKSMNKGAFLNSVKAGLIISNAKVEFNADKTMAKLILLNRSLTDLLKGTSQQAQQTAQPTQQPVQKAVIPPVRPIAPPTTTNNTVIPPIKPAIPPTSSRPIAPVIPPIVKSQPVQKPIQPTPLVQQSTQKQVQAASVPPVTPPAPTVSRNFDFDLYDITDTSGKPYFTTYKATNGREILTYNDKDKVDVKLGIDTSCNIKALELQKYLMDAEKEKNYRHIINLTYEGRRITAIDYCVVYREKVLNRLPYIVAENNIDLVDINRRTYRPCEIDLTLRLYMMPNLTFDIDTEELKELRTLRGRFIFANRKAFTDVISNISKRIDLEKYYLDENIVFTTHPKAKISETEDYSLRIWPNWPFIDNFEGHPGKVVINLQNTQLRFIGKLSIELSIGINYTINVPSTCKRLHDSSIRLVDPTSTALDIDKTRFRYYDSSKGTTREPYEIISDILGNTIRDRIENNIKYNRITVNGTNIDRLDMVGDYAEGRYAYSLIMNNWENVTYMAKTSVDIDQFNCSDKTIDILPYILSSLGSSEDQTTPRIVNNWLGIGTWSNIDKGKLALILNRMGRGKNYVQRYIRTSDPTKEKMNIYVDGTVKKATIYIIGDAQMPDIDTFFVAEGVEELSIKMIGLNSPLKAAFDDFKIHKLILPDSLKNFAPSANKRYCLEYIDNIFVPKQSVIARMNLESQLHRGGMYGAAVYEYDYEREDNAKNMLTDILGTDMNNVELVTFSTDSIKKNLSLLGIRI